MTYMESLIRATPCMEHMYYCTYTCQHVHGVPDIEIMCTQNNLKYTSRKSTILSCVCGIIDHVCDCVWQVEAAHCTGYYTSPHLPTCHSSHPIPLTRMLVIMVMVHMPMVGLFIGDRRRPNVFHQYDRIKKLPIYTCNINTSPVCFKKINLSDVHAAWLSCKLFNLASHKAAA